MNKLDNLPPIYIINLQRRSDRRSHILDNLLKYGIQRYVFINAIDYQKDNLENMVNNKILIKNSELACTLSHFKAIEHWLKTSDFEYAIIAEDDLCFDTVDYWNLTWEQYIKKIDFDFDILQLVIYNMDNDFKVDLHKRQKNDQSTAAYLIKRDHAEKMLNKFIINNKYSFPDYCVADHFLYNEGEVYAAGLFVIDERSIKSDINPEYEERQLVMRNKVLDYWKQSAK